MSDITLILGHPDAQSFSGALADAYTTRAGELGATITRFDLGSLVFDPVLRHGYRSEQALEPDLSRARDALVRAQHVVFVFPLWWTSLPALMKGFVDRVFTPGFAFAYRAGSALPVKLLAGRSARFVTTMDAPGYWYALRLRRALHASFVTGTLAFVGFSPIREDTFYGMRSSDPAARARALARVRRGAERDVHALAQRRPRLSA
jgi:NAD(P)H dehydrogenase (quinone)